MITILLPLVAPWVVQTTIHDDVIKWEHFPRYWPFVRGIHRSPKCFDVFFDLRLNKPLSKHSWGWWFETSSRSFWRHCNAVVPPVASKLIAWQLSVFNVYRDMVHHCLLVSFSWSRAIPGLGRNCHGMRCSDHWAGNGWPRQDLAKYKISCGYRTHKLIMCSHAKIMCSDNNKFLRWKLGVVGERLL